MMRNQLCNSPAAFLQVLVRPNGQAQGASLNRVSIQDAAAYRITGLLTGLPDPVDPMDLVDPVQLGEVSQLIWGITPRSGRSTG